MNKEFTKSNLKTGMIIKTRNGLTATVLLGTKNGSIFAGDNWGRFKSINDNLTSKHDAGYDITKIYQPRANIDFLKPDRLNDCDLIWERKE